MVRLSCRGVAWKVEPQEAEPLRRDLLEHIHELDHLPRATRIKDKRRRRVYRVELGGGRCAVVKVFRVRTRRDRLKDRLLGSKAQAEWTMSRRLLAMGLPASHAVAVGRPLDTSGEVRGYLVIEATGEAVGANLFLRKLGDPAQPAVRDEMLRLTRELARFVRRFHDAGVAHGDLHAGNILVREGAPSAGDRLLLIDLQAIRIGSPPGARRRARAIAQLWNTFGRGDAIRSSVRDAFLDAYLAAGEPLPRRFLSVAHLEGVCERLGARRLASRAKRCLKNTTRFAVEKLGDCRVHRRREYTADEILGLVEKRGGCCADDESSTAPGHGAAPLELRRFPARRGLGRLLGAFARSPAVREYAAAHRRRLETGAGPLPIAAVEWLRGPDAGRSVLVLEREDWQSDASP